jgi:hypothetical protein
MDKRHGKREKTECLIGNFMPGNTGALKINQSNPIIIAKTAHS